ncbi:hypothetical protein LZQ00_03120 [Sphingobacterium sp. SRCM116780]|uniref:hypothetical protein n=1 Tax=Sphingobacterium sp. SRCM116780 TaxID=2907623 RepID=UPI001F17943A|nr:hypothetical protein [Sphingobacterium sp. SRCM116780]UIR56816.1 hypothetical protein LZQ00_03120 [Sphingobacterium sp. SRCM116780]
MLTRLNYQIEIQADNEKVWNCLWEPENYKKWTSMFSEGSYYQTEELVTGNKIQLLTPKGDGMYSLLKIVVPNELLVLQHLGEIQNFKELPIDPTWGNAEEGYELVKKENSTLLLVYVDTLENYIDSMNKAFPPALSLLKNLAEQE